MEKTFDKEITWEGTDIFTETDRYGIREVLRTTHIETWTGLSGIYADKMYENKTVWENGVIVYSHNKPLTTPESERADRHNEHDGEMTVYC